MFVLFFSEHPGFHLLPTQDKFYFVLVGYHPITYSCLYAIDARLPLSSRSARWPTRLRLHPTCKRSLIHANCIAPISTFKSDTVMHTSAYTRGTNGVGDDAHPVDLASDRNSYVCVHQLTCFPWVFLWWAGVMGSVDIAFSQCAFSSSRFFYPVCIAFMLSNQHSRISVHLLLFLILVAHRGSNEMDPIHTNPVFSLLVMLKLGVSSWKTMPSETVKLGYLPPIDSSSTYLPSDEIGRAHEGM